MIDMVQLYRDHGIKFRTEGPGTQPGWMQTQCPFCDDRKTKLGWNLHEGYFNCWKCGHHKTEDTIIALLGIPEHEAWLVIRKYKLRPAASLLRSEGGVIEPARPTICIQPGYPLTKNSQHYKYLLKRKYDPFPVAKLWGLTCTDHLTPAKFTFRIICPVYYGKQIVSWQGRDITGKSDLRWKSCPKYLEVREHKHCIGGAQLVPKDSVAVVEGFTDAWRLGAGAVCTFGTDYLIEQVMILKMYKRRFVVLDSQNKDPNAAVQADKLANMLSAFPGETIIYELDEGDPGDLAQADADYLMTSEWRIR